MPFGTQPVFLAGMQTYQGRDTASIRYKDLTTYGVDIFIEEESQDSETAQNKENVGYFLFEPGNIMGY